MSTRVDAALVEEALAEIRPALLARDPVFAGNEAGFCAAYSEAEYVSDTPAGVPAHCQ